MSEGLLILPTPREILVLVVVAMAQESVLFPMLDYLDRAECAFVRKWLGGEYLRLFDFARSPKKLSFAALRKKFPDLTDEEYATLRSRLQDDVAEAVGECQRQRQPGKKVQLLLGAAEAFMNKQQPEDALRLLRKAISSAIAYEDYTYLDQMRGLRMLLPAYLPDEKRTKTKLVEIDHLLMEIAEQQRQVGLRIGWLQTALALKKGGYEGRTEKIHALLQAIPSFGYSDKSKSNLLLARTYWVCCDFLRNLEACIPFLDWAIELAQDSPLLWLDLDAFAAFQQAFFKRSTLFSAQYDFASSLRLIESFQAICGKVKKADPLILRDRMRLIQVRQLLHEGTSEEIERGLQPVWSELESSGSGSNDQASIILWILNHCLEFRKFNEAIPWLSLLQGKRFKIARTPRMVVSYLFEMAIHYASGDIASLENAVRRMVYHSKEMVGEETFVRVVATGFKTMAKATASDTKPIGTFMAQLEQIAETEAAKQYLKVFDLIQFLKDEITRRK